MAPEEAWKCDTTWYMVCPFQKHVHVDFSNVDYLLHMASRLVEINIVWPLNPGCGKRSLDDSMSTSSPTSSFPTYLNSSVIYIENCIVTSNAVPAFFPEICKCSVHVRCLSFV